MNEIPLNFAMETLSDLSISQIEIKDHYRLRSIQRNISDQWISDCLINKELLGILKQSKDKFRLYYEHPVNPDKYDLVIIITINLTKHITIITTYQQNINQRLRQHGPK